MPLHLVKEKLEHGLTLDFKDKLLKVWNKIDNTKGNLRKYWIWYLENILKVEWNGD